MAEYLVPPKGSCIVRCKHCGGLYMPTSKTKYHSVICFEECPFCGEVSNTIVNTIPVWKYNLLKFFRSGQHVDGADAIREMKTLDESNVSAEFAQAMNHIREEVYSYIFGYSSMKDCLQSLKNSLRTAKYERERMDGKIAAKSSSDSLDENIKYVRDAIVDILSMKY